MREQLSRLVQRPVALAGVALIAVLILAAIITIPMLASSQSAVAPVAELPTTATPTPKATPSTTPSATPDASSPPADEEAAPQTVPQPAPPPAEMDPGVIGMDPGTVESCGEFPAGQTIYRNFSWTAREGNSVDIYYAYTETDVQATSGFMLLESGLGATGTVYIPRSCPVGEGPYPLVTVRVVASNSQGSSTAHYWGL